MQGNCCRSASDIDDSFALIARIEALLPRAGGWMEAVKAFFGVLLLGVAIWLISPVIPAVANMLLWAALLIVSAIYLRALDPLPHPAKGWPNSGRAWAWWR